MCGGPSVHYSRSSRQSSPAQSITTTRSRGVGVHYCYTTTSSASPTTRRSSCHRTTNPRSDSDCKGKEMGGVGEKIMVSALTGVMGAVLGKLTNLMQKEYAMLKGVRKKLESLNKELTAIDAFLERYSGIEGPDVQAKAWTNEVRELAYDIEDSIDLFTYHVDREPADNTTGAKRFLRKVTKALRKVKKLEHRHKFAKQIKELQTLANEVYERRVRYNNLDEGTSSNMHTETDPRLKGLYVEVEKLVGVEGPSEEIISRLRQEPTKQLKVVSLVGSGGSGKTTLAKQVYEKIKDQFKCTAFVSVSQKPNISNLMREIESCLGSSKVSYSDKQVIDKVRARLEKTKYLIVIDDIWEKSAWESIQCALPKNGHASRIITTTRIKQVAEYCCTSNEDFVYRMKPLSRSDSIKLFLKRIFDAEDKCPDHLEGIMNEILHKCDGLPLAIVTLASLLANKPRRKEEWKRVLNSIRSVYEKDKELQVMDKILALSYSDLPHNLKNCLLYLSTFPEDHWIEKDILVWRWIAEGFITSKQGYTLEEIGESHFNELINRSLIQPMDVDYAYSRIEVSGCRVHDIVLNFIISRSTEENFVTVLDGQDLPFSDKRIRRISVWDNQERAEAISQGTMDLSQLRSLNICRVVRWTMPPVLDLPVLRALDLEGCRELRNVHLDGIVGLFHLRYLGLRETCISKLPVQIGKLEYLQMLDLRITSIRDLPESIVQLKRLVRLVGDKLRLPDGFGNMEALQELGTIDVCSSSVKDLQFLSKLRVLRVTFLYKGISDLQTTKESLASSLCKLGASNLRSLYINDRFGGADSWYSTLLEKLTYLKIRGFSRFPKCINPSLADLTYLGIDVEQMEGEDLRLLQDLPALLFLGLRVKQAREDGLRISPGGFRCLTRLELFNVYGHGLIFEGALPKLERLRLVFNADKAQSTYGSLHIGIQHLTSLKDIRMFVLVFSKDENTPTMKAAQSAINDQVKMLPNNPTLNIEICRVSRAATPDLIVIHDSLHVN